MQIVPDRPICCAKCADRFTDNEPAACIREYKQSNWSFIWVCGECLAIWWSQSVPEYTQEERKLAAIGLKVEYWAKAREEEVKQKQNMV